MGTLRSLKKMRKKKKGIKQPPAKHKASTHNLPSMAFSTEGLDGNDVDQSSIYDFTSYFYDKEEICTEVVFVKGLETPCTVDVIADFLLKCLTDIEVVDNEGKPNLDI